MASRPDEPPESIVIPGFSGIKNTVTAERLGIGELEQAVNVDIDDVGQLHRRRGYERKLDGVWHSLYTVGGKTYGVRDGRLGIIRPGYTFVDVADGGDAPISFTNIGTDIYYSSDDVSGKIVENETVSPWGETGGDRVWYSPVLQPTETLGEVGGKLLGKPPLASLITAFNGRIYLARGKTLWATELYMYNYVDKTRTYFLFEDEITLMATVDDGIYVGTTAAVYFLSGTLAEMHRQTVIGVGAVRGSAVIVPSDIVHPAARTGDVPVSDSVVFMTPLGVCAGFKGGQCFNITQGRVEFPQAANSAALFRRADGANHYIAVADSAGSPSANARIGDYVDAEIRRFTGG